MGRVKYTATQYISDILRNRISACDQVKKAVKRHVDDIVESKQDPEYLYYFDKESAYYAIEFFKYLRHSKGEWAGQVFRLEPWQQFIIWVLFGWLRKSDKMRRFSVAYIEVPRKNGKSTLLAGIGLFLFFADGEPGAEVYTAATKRDQALLVHSEATRMVKSSPDLSSRITAFKNNLNYKNSKFEPLGADADTMDGLNVHGAIIDELHAHKRRDLWDVLDTATGSRRQSMMIAITTSGFNKHSICWEQHDYTEKINNGIVEDDSHFGIIYTIDEGDSWEDEQTWQKANPNYGKSVKIHDFRRQAHTAGQLPAKLNSFLRLKLDIWTEAESRWFSPESWAACGGEYCQEDLRGRKCYAGLDLSSSNDITAWVLVFPPIEETEKFKIICRFFIPKDNVHDRVSKDRVPFDVWIREGHITATPGNSIDYRYIIGQIDKDALYYDIEEVAFDRWGSTTIAQMLQEREMEMVAFGQGWASMSPAAKDLERYILKKIIEHNNNPVMNWMADNVVLKEDESGNIKPDKKKSTEKIDGIVALCMALDRALRHHDEKSIYETEGVFVI